ncbi:hypothetical protein BJ165DRAFT_1398112 [Panaeolus papilionaceus]|nr:hypothetical protein BJ165DRAFT_1398112 [Panaeolus papilionaceus]
MSTSSKVVGQKICSINGLLLQDGPSEISHSQNSQEPCAPKDAKVKRKRQQPTPQYLATLGIKVRDFAYESKLPPVKTVYRQPKQIQPSSQPVSQGPRPLERTLTEPVIEPDSQPESLPVTRFQDTTTPGAVTQPHIPNVGTPMDVDSVRLHVAKPPSRALQPSGKPMRISTPAPQPIPMVPTSPIEHPASLSTPIPPSSPEPFARPQVSVPRTLSRNASRQLLESQGRNVAFVRSPYKLRKRPCAVAASAASPPPPAKRRRVNQKAPCAKQESEIPLPATRRRKPAARGKGRRK